MDWAGTAVSEGAAGEQSPFLDENPMSGQGEFQQGAPLFFSN